MEKYYLAAIATVSGIGSARLKLLKEKFGSAENIWNANAKDLLLHGCLTEKLCNHLLEQQKNIDVYHLAESLHKKNILIYSMFDKEYPFLLKQTYNPPPVLYCRGEIPDTLNTVAIVGARSATVYGKNAANMLALELSKAGFWIISGAARGIDTCAHRGALSTGRTIAVLGCGVDIAYPPENATLLAQIAECGAIISEYPPGTLPHPGYFPARNRIISGLSKAVIIVEAAEKSGALITADFALEESRDVFAVPGSIFSRSSKGTNNLIKQGAKLIVSANDILQEYNMSADHNKQQQLLLLEEEQKVYDSLSFDVPISIEEIIEKVSLSVSAITYILLQFQLSGLVTEHGGKYYVKVAREGL